MRVRLIFDNGKTSINEVSEKELIKQMSRAKEKRLYTCGVEFSAVVEAEVLEG